MAVKKYEHLIVTEDIRPQVPPPAGFMKRMENQRKAGDYLDSFHMLSLNDKIAKGALYYDAKLGPYVPSSHIERATSGFVV